MVCKISNIGLVGPQKNIGFLVVPSCFHVYALWVLNLFAFLYFLGVESIWMTVFFGC